MALIQEHYLQAIAEVRFAFGISIGVLGLLCLALVLVGIAVLFYRKTTRPLSRAWKAGLISLRAATLLLLAFLLLEPGVLVSEVVPQETYVAVLVDDSQSMGIRDQSDVPNRHMQSVELLYGRGELLADLSDTFQVRSYRFSDLAQRLPGPEALQSEGGRSALGASIEQVVKELNSFPLAGIVVVSDGADNGELDPLAAARNLADRKIPLYTVAVGAENIARDINLLDVSAAGSLLEDSVFRVQVSLNQRGYAGQRARLRIQQGDALIAEQNIALPDEGSTRRFTLELNPKERDILVYTVSVEELPGETIRENNRHTFFVDNRQKKPFDLLYVEGQPRDEYKFIRRAVKDDRS